jgi:hypothetical protein
VIRVTASLSRSVIFNHSQFFGPAAVNGNISSANFGQIQTASPPRLIQLAARIRF